MDILLLDSCGTPTDVLAMIADRGIDWVVYSVWDDYSTSVDCDALGDYLAALYPDFAATWTGNIM
jgi:hypothetical protein